MKRIRNFFENKCIMAVMTTPIPSTIPVRHELSQFGWIWLPIWAREGLVEIETFSSILSNSLFPKWCELLCERINKGGDLNEAMRYYQFWKQLVGREFIARGYLIDVFMEVLRLMHENIPEMYLL